MNPSVSASLEIRAQEIFFQAIDLVEGDERTQYVETACEGDSELRKHTENLLAAHETSGEQFLTPSISPPIAEQPGDMVGRYELVREVGDGGFGIVFEAKQSEPVTRRVALKIIKPGMDTREVIARFEAERQALAMLDHPAITKIFDAGATESGRPYFAMELVGGVPITSYCKEKATPLRERLSLFIVVCQAVQHAHQKGMIHRDLKPSNMLVAEVDDVARPTIIDFGIAKVIGAQATPDLTLTGHFVGTPLYMSPEQAATSGELVDTRSDVYALGSVLYELLAGSPPISDEMLKTASLTEVAQVIAEFTPPAPSVRASQVHGTELPPQLLANELDWVALKALEKDPDRRYQTVSELGQDLQRFLDYRPVTATPPSAWYRMRKFVRRHRAPLVAVAAVALALLAGAAGSVWQAVRATIAEQNARGLEHLANERWREAEGAREEAQEVSGFLEKMLQDLDPRLRGQIFSSEKLLDNAVKRLETRFEGKPKGKIHLLNVLGASYDNLGYRAKAEEASQQALQLCREHLPANHPETASALINLANIGRRAQRNRNARQYCNEALEILTQLHDPDHESVVACRGLLAHIAINEGNIDEAIAIREQIVNHFRDLKGPVDQVTLFNQNKLAFLYSRSGRPDEAFTIYREVVEAATKADSSNRDNLVVALIAMAQVHLNNNDPKAALEIALQVEPYRDKIKKDNVVRSGVRIADAWFELGETEKAIEKYEKTLMLAREFLGEEHPSTLAARTHFVDALCKAGQPERALVNMEKIVATQQKILGSQDANLAWSLRRLAKVRRLVGDKEGWVRALEERLAVHKALPETRQEGLRRAMDQLLEAYCETGRLAEAQRLRKELETLADNF